MGEARIERLWEITAELNQFVSYIERKRRHRPGWEVPPQLTRWMYERSNEGVRISREWLATSSPA